MTPTPTRTLVVLLGACWLAPASAQQGYRLTANAVEVSTQAQWQAWSMAPGLVTVSPSGTVGPRRLAQATNGAVDASDFTYEIPGSLRSLYDNAFDDSGVLRARGGIKRAGTNPSGASRAMDGDRATFWEPDSSAALDSWWLELDLGRLVSATRIVLRFADSTATAPSDPFLQFRVHTATGQNPFGDESGALEYEFGGGTTRPNTGQREFGFELAPTLTHATGWTGRLVQYVRVAVTDRRGARGEEVDEPTWQALAAADRGAVEHVWHVAGEDRLVTEGEYGALPEAERGGRRFFRRERARLAEVEVWTAGENVALGLLERGGSLQEGNPNAAVELAFDGSIRTNWNATVFSTVGDIAGWGLLTADLGALLRVDAIRIITRRAEPSERILYGYELRGSDGSLAPDGSLIWEALSGDDRLLNQDTRLFEDRFDARALRFLEFRNLDVARRTNAHLGHRFQSAVSEIQIYASGYPPEVVLESDLIDLRDARSLRTIAWDALTPPGTAVEIRTRTGNDLREVGHYFLSSGEEVTKAEYDKKPSFFQGPVEIETVPGPGWSSWSQAYVQSGERIRSPSPRRYMRIEARLLADTPDTAATLRALRVNTLAPVADELVAEIAPKADVPVGQAVDFDVYLQPAFSTAGQRGFDLVRLTAPARAALTLRGVASGDEAQLAAGGADAFIRAAGDSLFRNPSGLVLGVEGEGFDALRVHLPTAARRSGPQLVRLSFTSTVFQSGSTFQVEVAHSATEEIWQEADPGDVVGDDLAQGSGLTVLTPPGGGNIRLIRAGPSVFTPNGDGRGDVAVFEFAVLKVNVDRQVRVRIYDLRGRQVRRLSERRDQANGLYRIEWDGRDDGRQLVPPGLYVARIDVETDAGDAPGAAVTVAVAY